MSIFREEPCTKENIIECQDICAIQYFGSKDFYNIVTNECEQYLSSCPEGSSLDKAVNKCVSADGSVI
jgi:hypothetical protein